MNTRKIVHILFFGAFAFLGCATDQSKTVSFDTKLYSLTSSDALALVGDSTIPRRAESYGMKAGDYARPKFATIEDGAARERLEQAMKTVLDLEIDAAEITEVEGELFISNESGFAIAAEGTGTLVVKKLNVPRTATIVKNAEEAVDLALVGIAQSELISLVEHETLDVVGVVSTHYAGWIDSGGEEMTPVYFINPESDNLVTEYKSDYTVYFGRRYRGVPILGPTLGVRLDANGEMVAFMKGWRDIDGETPVVTVLDSSEVTSAAAESADDALELEGTACGFTEGTDTTQTAAGIGCALHYINTKSVEPLAAKKVEWVNLTEDSSIDLGLGEETVEIDDETVLTED